MPSRRWGLALAVHIVALLGFMLLYTGLRLLISPPAQPGTFKELPVTLGTAVSPLRANVFEQFWMYTSIAVFAMAFQYQAKLRERDLRELRMQQQLAEYEFRY